MQKILKTKFAKDEAILADIQKGGRFMQFQYACIGYPQITISPSNIYYVPAGHSAFRYGWPYFLICLILGLGIGLIYYRQRNVTLGILNAHQSDLNRGLNRTISDTVWRINDDIDNNTHPMN